MNLDTHQEMKSIPVPKLRQSSSQHLYFDKNESYNTFSLEQETN